MLKNYKEDIFRGGLNLENLMHVGLVTNNIKVGVIGAGRASLIKTRTFLKAGCTVEVLSPKFNINFNYLESSRLRLKKGKYYKKFLNDKHIVIIGVSNKELEKRIIRHCKRLNKLYLVCSDYKLGNLRLCAQKRADRFLFSLSVGKGNPKLAIYLTNKIMDFLKSFSTFCNWATTLRENLAHHPKKEQIMEFVCSDDFYYFFKKGYADKVIKLFFENVKL